MTDVVVPTSEEPAPRIVPFYYAEPKGRWITLNVPQGVGDIFWCYQKFSPYFDQINFNILVTQLDKIQGRAADWLTIFSKTGSVNFLFVSDFRYIQVISRHYSTKDIMDEYNNGLHEFDFACNLPLEEGMLLVDIDPDFPVETGVAVSVHECQLPFSDYITVYVSGSTKSNDPTTLGIWTPDQWMIFIEGFRVRFNMTEIPVILVGASYDEETARHLSAMMHNLGIETHVCIDSYPANVLYIIKNGRCFLNYQSGLSVLADNINAKQVMMYFKKLKPMMYSWCKKENIGKVFHADLFSTDPMEVVKGINLQL